MCERIILVLNEPGYLLASELLDENLILDIGEVTNKEWKELRKDSNDIDIALASNLHHPDYIIIGSKNRIIEIANKYKISLLFQMLGDNKKIYNDRGIIIG